MYDVTVATPMTEGVLTVGSEECAGDLVEALVELEIKSVVVTDDECRPLGILTSTDYLRMLDDGVDPHETTVGEWMTREVITVRYDETVQRAATVMHDRGVSHLPVVDADGRAIGILSSTDLTAHLAGAD